MKDIKALALNIAALELFYRRIKDCEGMEEEAEARLSSYKEALEVFEEIANISGLKGRQKAEILQWAKDVVEARRELMVLFQKSPSVRMFQLLLGYNKTWNFAGYKRVGSKYPQDSEFSSRSVDALVQFIHGSPERDNAMEALMVLAGAVQNWSLAALVDIRVAIENVKRKPQGSFSKGEVVKILEDVIEQVASDLEE